MAIPDYDELKLRVEPAGGGAYHVVAFGPGDAIGKGDFTRPISDTELENFVLRVARPRAVRGYQSTQMEEAKRLGRSLFEQLLAGQVGDVYHGARRLADSQGRGLRISLSMTDAPELLELPWELLYDPAEASFLSQSIFTPVVRSLDLMNPRPPLKTALPLRLLAVVSSPEGFHPLDIPAERAKLEKALAALIDAGSVQIEWLESATLDELDRRIAAPDEQHVIHYIGHGAYNEQNRSGIVVLEDSRGQPHEVTGEELGACMRDERSLRLVVLNSCEGSRGSHVDPFSGVAASLLRCGLPAVVGMQAEITDDAAISFSDRFYTALAQGFPIDAALAQARRAIFNAGGDVEFGTPVLFMRVADGRIFDFDENGAPPPPPVGRLELGLDADPEIVREGGTVTWKLRIRNAGDSALREVAARDQAGATRAGPLVLDPGETHEASWPEIVERDVDERITVEGRGSDSRLVSAQASGHVAIEEPTGGGWMDRLREHGPLGVGAAVGALVVLVGLVIVAVGALGGDDGGGGGGPEVRPFPVGADVLDLDARGDKVAFLAATGSGDQTSIRRLDLLSGKPEDVVDTPVKHNGLDVGLSAAGHAQLVYSRCDEASACDIYTSPFHGDEKPSTASTPECSEIRPTMYDGSLLFVRGGTCPSQLMLLVPGKPEPVKLADTTGGSDLNKGFAVWLAGGELFAEAITRDGRHTSKGRLRPTGGDEFRPPLVVEGDFVYFIHDEGSQHFIARVRIPLDDSEIQHYSPGDDVTIAEENAHFAVTGDTLYTTNYPQPNGEPGTRVIVRVRHPTFQAAE